jgi:hypothetical protein
LGCGVDIVVKAVLQVIAVFVVLSMVVSGGWYYTVVNDSSDGDDSFRLDQFNDTLSKNPVGDAPSPIVGLPIDLSEVSTYDKVQNVLDLSPEQIEFLSENGLVGVADPPRTFEMFAPAYEWISEDKKLPVFVTSDSMMDAYHLIFDELLVQLEESMLIEDAIVLASRMMDAFDALRTDLPTEHQHLAEENVAFFGAALRLFDPDATVPDYVEETVNEIVGLAENASGFIIPPGFERMEDFSQYKPRGHYTRSSELGRYFRGMMWLGRITFHAVSDSETQRAIMIALELAADKEASYRHHRISSVVDYMVGAADDLTHLEYAQAAGKVFGNMGSDYSPIFDAGKLEEFKEHLVTLRRPKILSELVVVDEIGPGGWEELVQGMRVFGQRFVPDSYIFQNCVFNAVPGRFMPTVLDVMAALGSEEAWEREDFEGNHEKFEENLGSLRDEFAGLQEGEWKSTLYMSWLDALTALHEDTSTEDYPMFMRTEAWKAKQLNTQAASWTQLTHDTILYRKQSYSTVTSVQPIATPSNFTYVEPVPQLWERLDEMVMDTKEFLNSLDLTNQLILRILNDFHKVLESLKRVAQAQLDGVLADPQDLEAARNAYKITTMTVEGVKLQSKTVVVSDVHTDPNAGTCLEEGVGYVKFIVVVVPTPDGPVACVGPVFQHHEFAQPLSEGRLTDEEWIGMLEAGTAPEMAPWAKDFMP